MKGVPVLLFLAALVSSPPFLLRFEGGSPPFLFFSGSTELYGRTEGPVGLGQIHRGWIGPAEAIEILSENRTILEVNRSTLLFENSTGALVPQGDWEGNGTSPHSILLVLPMGSENSSVFVSFSPSQTLLMKGGSGAVLSISEGRVSILDERGKSVPGWSRNPVRGGSLLFRIQGDWNGSLEGGGVALSLRNGTLVRFSISPSPSRFESDTLRELSTSKTFFGAENPWSSSPTREVLVGALPLLRGGGILWADRAEKAHLLARERETPIEKGAVLFPGKSEVAVAYDRATASTDSDLLMIDGRFEGTSFPLIAGVPAPALVLWALALLLFPLRFVKREPRRIPKIPRPLSWVVSLGALLLAFVLWDGTFFSIFHTSALSLFLAREPLESASLLFLLEVFTWSLSSFLFGTPWRIALTSVGRWMGASREWRRIFLPFSYLSALLLGRIYLLFFLGEWFSRPLFQSF